MGALSSDRQALLVTHAAVAVDVDQPLDVHRDLLAELTLDLVVLLDDATDRCDLDLREVMGADRAIDARLLQDLDGGVAADAENVGERNVDALVAGQVDALNACHIDLPLSLLVLRVLTQDPDNATPTNDAAFVTDLLYACFDLHVLLLAGKTGSTDGVLMYRWAVCEGGQDLCSGRSDSDGVLKVRRG